MVVRILAVVGVIVIGMLITGALLESLGSVAYLGLGLTTVAAFMIWNRSGSKTDK